MQKIDVTLVREHGPALFAYAYRTLQRREDAEDVVQETWMSALGSIARFEGRSSMRSWLTRILMRRIADRFRRHHPLLPLGDDEPSAPQEATPAEADVDAVRMAALSAEALDMLTPLERRALVMDLSQIDRDEAAQALGVTRGHLRVLLHRARQKVEQRLRRAGFTPEL
ncbi:MAG: sigma-70 family RNA polymerase sigma factor [Polyangiales bacterium]